MKTLVIPDYFKDSEKCEFRYEDYLASDKIPYVTIKAFTDTVVCINEDSAWNIVEFLLKYIDTARMVREQAQNGNVPL